ncbi:unnamed protein product [Urochloa decumbens]|uniref:4-coumarate--CoA ligase n=1 Tax=Urochloa decumbens TaxID=240449 RepID=A0ABC9CN44_9POAL
MRKKEAGNKLWRARRRLPRATAPTACTVRRAWHRRPSSPPTHRSPSPTSSSAAPRRAPPRSPSWTPPPRHRPRAAHLRRPPVRGARHGRRGDAVLLLAPNSVLYPVCFLAAAALGAVATTANPLSTPREIAKQAADARAVLVVTVSHLLPKIAALRLPAILLDDAGGVVHAADNVTLYSDLVAGVDEAEYRRPAITRSDTAALFYSSGTTGESKGAELTHGNFVAAAAAAAVSDQDDDDDELAGTEGRRRNVSLCFLPMFHAYGMSVVTLAQLQRGNAVVVMARFEVGSVLAAVERHRVTHLFCAPPVMVALAKHGEAAGTTSAHSGASPSAQRRSARTSWRPWPVNSRTPTLSRLMHNARIFQQCASYTEFTIKHGWLHTGDLGYFDETGQLYVVDRLKELIKYKGFQIAPAELEGLLLSHAEILDAAVVPYPDPEAGEVPIAYVVRSSNSSLSEADVQKFIEKQVAYYKRLRKVTFVDTVPKSASGKILRRELIVQVRSSKL